MAKINPVFSAIQADEYIDQAASRKGIAGKTFILLGIAVLSAIFAISFSGFVTSPFVWFAIVLGALIAGIVGQMNPNAAKVASFIYAFCEGAMLGLLSFLFNAVIGGVVLSAVTITATIFGVMLLLYSTNILRATSRFVRGMMGIGMTILICSGVYFIAYLINPNNILVQALFANPAIFLLVSGLNLLYGAFMLIMDFENVNNIVVGGFDKKYEWMAALGLMVTLVWIYVEVLRILSYIAMIVSDNN